MTRFLFYSTYTLTI